MVELEWGTPAAAATIASLTAVPLDLVVAADCCYVDQVTFCAALGLLYAVHTFNEVRLEAMLCLCRMEQAPARCSLLTPALSCAAPQPAAL